MGPLKDRILEYVKDHDVDGLHDVTIAHELSAPAAEVLAELEALRDEGKITAKDVVIVTTRGATKLDNIRLVED